MFESKENFSSPNKNLYQVLSDSVDKHSKKKALTFFEDEITYEDLHSMVKSFSCSLREIGVSEGDRVAIFLPNSPQFVVSFFAAIRIGATPVPLNPLYTSSELASLLDDSGAKLVVTLKKFFPKVNRASDQIKMVLTDLSLSFSPIIKLLYRLQTIGARIASFVNNGATASFKNMIEEGPVDCKGEVTDPAILMYTSGTTGDPKGVPLSHENIVSNLFQINQHIGDAFREGEEVVLGVLPFFHVYGLNFVLNHSLMEGYNIVLMPKFGTNEACGQIEENRVTVLPGVPSLFKALLGAEVDWSSIRFLGSGASPCPPELIKKAEEKTKSPLVEAYGLTESSPVTHMNPPEGTRKAGSVGILLPGTKAKVVGNKKMGELLIKGPQVFSGYWRSSAESGLEEGWLHTGDIVRVDEDGYFYIQGRVDGMINVRGEKVWPREIEEVIEDCPGVDEAAVIGLDDDYYGQVPKAFVSGNNLVEEDILGFCREHLTEYKVPKKLEIVKSIPKNHLGKKTHYILRERENGQ